MEILKFYSQRILDSENGRNVKLWNQEQFNDFFKDFNIEKLHEIGTNSWDRIKIIWVFVAKVK